jgi:hypothetical protein
MELVPAEPAITLPEVSAPQSRVWNTLSQAIHRQGTGLRARPVNTRIANSGTSATSARCTQKSKGPA